MPDAPAPTDVDSILALLSDDHPAAAGVDDRLVDALTEGRPDHDPSDDEPIVLSPGRRAGAVAWVLVAMGSLVVLCVGVTLVGALFLVSRAEQLRPEPVPPHVYVTPTPTVPSASTSPG